MDLFLINGHEGISLPEMIDWDIKLSDSDISKEVGVNSLLGYDLPLLDAEDGPNSLWSQTYSANSNSSFDLDFLGEGASSLLVNPSSVMPFVSSTRKAIHIDDADEKKKVDLSEQTSISLKNEDNCLNQQIEVELLEENSIEATLSADREIKETICSSQEQAQDLVTLPINFISVPNDHNFIKIASAKKMLSQKRQVAPNIEENEKVYPKPAYSYSCLIAMALKNSQSGCLPVSEIYSFMCHHFPYFKTAPNGWKNSVRHNLSLNKCFEKIEKPIGTTGNSQRKGCLWAMNPAKIIKMDEEVAKWSKKDPLAIKSAMVYPDNLELLERGELKDEAAFGEVEVEDETEEVKEEEVDFRIDVEDNRMPSVDDDSDEEISRVPPSLQPFEPKFAKKAFKSHKDNCGILSDLTHEIDLEISNSIFEELEPANRRMLLSVDDSMQFYAVDQRDENTVLELPILKKPRVQGSYICHPIMKRHKISSFTSIKIQSP